MNSNEKKNTNNTLFIHSVNPPDKSLLSPHLVFLLCQRLFRSFQLRTSSPRRSPCRPCAHCAEWWLVCAPSHTPTRPPAHTNRIYNCLCVSEWYALKSVASQEWMLGWAGEGEAKFCWRTCPGPTLPPPLCHSERSLSCPSPDLRATGKMGNMATEIVAFLLTISGWILVSSTLPTDYWKVSSVDGTVITTATFWSNLWKTCVTDSTGVSNCKDFPSMLALDGEFWDDCRCGRVWCCLFSGVRDRNNSIFVRVSENLCICDCLSDWNTDAPNLEHLLFLDEWPPL